MFSSGIVSDHPPSNRRGTCPEGISASASIIISSGPILVLFGGARISLAQISSSRLALVMRSRPVTQPKHGGTFLSTDMWIGEISANTFPELVNWSELKWKVLTLGISSTQSE